MPGIAGIVSANPQDNIDSALARMTESLWHCDWYKREQFVAPQRTFACAHVHLGILPTHNAPYRWLHGEESDGFTRVEYDPRTQTLTITNDPFGMMPLFYYHTAHLLVYGTELKAVLAHPAVTTQLDPRGLADLLAFGFIFGEKTLVRNVHCLPGGSQLRFNARADKLTLERMWDFRQHIGRGMRKDSGVLDEVARRFKHAVADRCRGDLQIGVSLSGGYDSRTIQAAIDHRQRVVKTLTLDVRGGADQIISEQIARVTNGIENHTFIENSNEFFARWPQYVREMVWLTDGQFFDEACVMMSTLDKYRELGVHVALRGHGGEIARMQWAYELTCNRLILACKTQPELKAQLFRQMRWGLDDRDINSLLGPDLADAVRDSARQTMDEAFAGVEPSLHLVDQVTCVYVQEYLRRQSVPSLAELRSRVEVRMPFLDRDYVAAVLQLAPEARLGTGVHRHLLKQFNPALLKITNANTGASAGASDFAQRLYRKVNTTLKRHGYERFKHYADVPGWLRGPLRPHVEAVLLDKRTLNRGVYRADGVRGLFEDHMSGRADRGAALLLLLFLELWHRQFVDGEFWRS
jgi:asparagine synthase (glutamine-hydrolysing)